MRALVGKKESITLKEAIEYRDKANTEFLYYMKAIIDEATEDDEERSNISVKMAEKLGTVMSSCELVGVLMGDDAYISNLPHNEGVKIVDLETD